MRPIILDLDGSVGALEGCRRIDLTRWCDPLRFGCSMASLRDFERDLKVQHLNGVTGPQLAFIGSGDFHHLSLPLISEATAGASGVQVVVFDNHPDNMRFPVGVHCGSWVWRVARLPQVAQVHVVGITSGDIGASHAWENHLRPLYRGRVCYWSTGVDVAWAKRLRLGHAICSFNNTEAMLEAFLSYQSTQTAPIYLSIDKDVLDPAEAMSNWDQGVLRVAQLVETIEQLHHRLLGGDVNGEISIAVYRTLWKRLLSGIDGQAVPDASRLHAWQQQQHAVNLRLLAAFTGRRAV